MLQRNQLQSLSTPQLLQLDEVLLSYTFKQPNQGEPIHPNYKKNKASFKMLIKQQINLERIVRDFRRKQLKDVHSLLHLHLITAKDIVFTPSKDLEKYVNTPAWEQSNTEYANTLADGIYPIYDNGAKATADDIGIGTNVDSSSAPSAKFLSNYVVKLAGDLNKTTKQDVTQAINTSLQLGENRDELTKRIDDILDDPYRSEMIAQTESIRAFTQGRLDVGQEIGYDLKTWNWPGNSDCPICPTLQAQGAIPIDEDWDTGSDSLGNVSGPPSHPWCQCGITLSKSSDNVEASEVKGGWITKNGVHILIDEDTGEVVTDPLRIKSELTNEKLAKANTLSNKDIQRVFTNVYTKAQQNGRDTLTPDEEKVLNSHGLEVYRDLKTPNAPPGFGTWHDNTFRAPSSNLTPEVLSQRVTQYVNSGAVNDPTYNYSLRMPLH